VEETLDQCRHILEHLSGKHEELSAEVDRLGAVVARTLIGSPEDRRSLYRAARELQSRCMLGHLPHLPPIACFGRHEFGGPFGIGTYMCWNIVSEWGCTVRVFDPAAPPVRQVIDPKAPDRPAERTIFDDPQGTIFDMNVSYDAKTLFLAYKHKANDDSYHLYEIPPPAGRSNN